MDTPYRKLLAAKIHRATVTGADVNYEGSLTVPPELLVAANIHPYESLHVWNVTRGTRLETYAIEGKPGSSDVCANGAAAHLIRPGDHVILAAYAFVPESEAATHVPRLVFVDENNHLSHMGPEIAGPTLRNHDDGGMHLAGNPLSSNPLPGHSIDDAHRIVEGC